jgi:predicted oxidoreductase
MFFDERRRVVGPLTPVEMGHVRIGTYEWSADNSKEIAAGWILAADDIVDLARQAGVEDPEAVGEELADYQDACRGGTDRFGRAADTLTPMAPPYYCMKLYPGGTNTLGGPQRNENAQIIDAFGQVIPGLYGAGELGGAMGALYPGAGSSISDGLCFGRIAGRHAILGAA